MAANTSVPNIHKLELGRAFFLNEDTEVTNLLFGSSGTLKVTRIIPKWAECFIFKHNARSTGIFVEIERDVFVPMPRKSRAEAADYTTMYATPAFEYITVSKDHVIAGQVYEDKDFLSSNIRGTYAVHQQKTAKKPA